MSTVEVAPFPPSILQIGETAGIVWSILDAEGRMSITKLVKKTELSRDLVMQAIGWLAREGKVEISDKGRWRMISLV